MNSVFDVCLNGKSLSTKSFTSDTTNSKEVVNEEEDFYRFLDDMHDLSHNDNPTDSLHLQSSSSLKTGNSRWAGISSLLTAWEASLIPPSLAAVACVGGWAWSVPTLLHAGRGALALALVFLCSPVIATCLTRYALLTHAALIYGFLQGFPQHQINHAFYVAMLVFHIDCLWTKAHAKHVKTTMALVVISTAQLVASLAMSPLQGPYHLFNDICLVAITMGYILHSTMHLTPNLTPNPAYTNATLVKPMR